MCVSLANMFGLGFWEIAIILVVALIVLGPSKLPELARGLGKGLREFRKATEDFKSTIEEEMHKPEPAPPRPAPQLTAQSTTAIPPPASTALPTDAPQDAPAVPVETSSTRSTSDKA